MFVSCTRRIVRSPSSRRQLPSHHLSSASALGGSWIPRTTAPWQSAPAATSAVARAFSSGAATMALRYSHIPLTPAKRVEVANITTPAADANLRLYLLSSLNDLKSQTGLKESGDEEAVNALLQLADDRGFKAEKQGSMLIHRTSGGSDVGFVGVGKRAPAHEVQYSALDLLEQSGEDSGWTTLAGARVGRAIGALAVAHHKTAGHVELVLVAGNDPAAAAAAEIPHFVRSLVAQIMLWQQPEHRFKGGKSETVGAGVGAAPAAAADDKEEPRSKPPVEKLWLRMLGPAAAAPAAVAAAVASGAAAAVGGHLARELVVAPANYCNPESLAATLAGGRGAASPLGPNVTVKVLGRAELEERKMHAYLSVNAGSAFEPRLIHGVYKGPGPVSRRVVLVGKGVTMDTGGYNLKVGAGIETMKFDMGGAAAVFGALAAVAQQAPAGVELHAIVAAAENMIDARATRPGDIVTAANGRTIEVNNTDAEGRLTLADALVYAQKEVPDAAAYVDVATLTGACMVGLGMEIAALYANNPGVMRGLLAAAKRTGTPIWPMPLYAPYKAANESALADVSNLPNSRYGGSINAALFLAEFVRKTAPWAHIDIAGPVWDDKAKTATAYAVHMLADFAIAEGAAAH